MKLVSLQIIFLCMTLHSTIKSSEQEAKKTIIITHDELVKKLDEIRKKPYLCVIMCHKLHPSPYIQEINPHFYKFFKDKKRLSVEDGLKELRTMHLLDEANRLPTGIDLTTARKIIIYPNPPSATEQA